MLHPDRAKNLQFHKALFNKTIEIVKESKLPFIIIDEGNQYGESFGEKYCNAIEYCFDSGYHNLITIGSDCASLSAKNILEAHGQFQNNCNSIGADSHGGFYLLALQKKDYHRNSFLNFGWNSKLLFRNFNLYFKNNLQQHLFLLTKQQDVNTAANLYAVISSSFANRFIKLLTGLCKGVSDYVHSITSFLQNTFSKGFALRGPPTVSAF